jgi:hypothetical protein
LPSGAPDLRPSLAAVWATRLLGAAAALRLDHQHPHTPAQQPHYQASLAAGRAALPPPLFAPAWDEGRAMSVEQAVALARSGPAGE